MSAETVKDLLVPVKKESDERKDAGALLQRKRMCENHDDGTTEVRLVDTLALCISTDVSTVTAVVVGRVVPAACSL